MYLPVGSRKKWYVAMSILLFCFRHLFQIGMTAKDQKSSAPNNSHQTTLYKDIGPHQWPIIYSSRYNIGFMKMEKLHPFDSGKWGKIIRFLKEGDMITDDTIVEPQEATDADLLVVHTTRYLSSLKWSINVARVLEVPPIAFLPNFLVRSRVLRPLRYQTGGTILAGKLALERGFAINVGGGFHHCSGDAGGGFCAYADITLLIHFLFNHYPEKIKKVMIVDLDAHQGNGHERDFMTNENVFIIDMYNSRIYPHDESAKKAIDLKIELEHHTNDSTYLNLLEKHLEKSLDYFHPDFGVATRDEIVFTNCIKKRQIPIVMCTSGGYQQTNARVIADSLFNLHKKELISCDAAEELLTKMVEKKTVKDLEELKTLVNELGKDKRIFVLFSGSKDKNGESWCPDCVTADPKVEASLKHMPDNGVFVYCPVGDRATWKDANNPFRKDPATRLTNVPTYLEYGTKKKLVESDLSTDEGDDKKDGSGLIHQDSGSSPLKYQRTTTNRSSRSTSNNLINNAELSIEEKENKELCNTHPLNTVNYSKTAKRCEKLNKEASINKSNETQNSRLKRGKLQQPIQDEEISDDDTDQWFISDELDKALSQWQTENGLSDECLREYKQLYRKYGPMPALEELQEYEKSLQK
ncbi:unnamed protein product [Didymodactylos carnosus]|uniref:Thioredoxin domain-containing protein 17 n=1 Tax=Didymodactylos carnosus TaxID=1234261 RepID=A0A814VYI7_9BILA|nr:unnamed protein product [Didymodactylos carnosus]CAF1194130.1 unnamed protein product [Didymodactylos carnosus]CAF3958477.1 unnamed protein product [Didymodactylos carnosus]CAF3966793.1 unnamed protein product [Didymodactylos carnosus]